jgi:hypothetical protein
MATAKKAIKVKEVLSDNSIYGYLGGVVTYTPKVFKEMRIPKAKQFSVDIEPMSDEDCTAINSLNRSQQLLMSLWYVSEDGKKFTEANKKLSKFTGDEADFTEDDFSSVQLLEKQRTKVNNDSYKFAIVQKYINNLSTPHPLAGTETIDDVAWGNMPKKIKADIYNAIIDMSMLSESDAVNLQ